ncbi:MAG: hypothetical protein Fur0020_03840 [Thermodesulfovibrionia bacterium]
MVNISEFKDAYDNPHQRELLLRLFSTVFIKKNFFLTGGTALSVFYAGHRRSKDIDLFLLREINLLEYVRVFREAGKLLSVISEGSSFCSYIYEGGIKVDYVFDKFSCSVPVNHVTINGEKINLDTPRNIAINKITAVVSRTEPKDIIDLTWLFKNIFSPEKDFLSLFNEATKREAILEDTLFVKGVFNYISINSDKYLDILKPSLLINISSYDISLIFRSFEGIMESLIK